ncbi:MAG: serine/threonine protein kinase [Bacteroidales bacterium]|nr:serine/threonine protein kinase [Candidatus Liminaster caballi]
MITNDDDLISGFIDNENYGQSVADLSSQFVIRSEVVSQGYNRLVRACREGKWYMLKGLKPDYAGIPLFRQMLKKEYELHRSLTHPNIAQCYGLEEVEGLGTCIVMEYVQGKSLRQFMTEGQYMPVETYLPRAQRIAREVAEGMAYMHSLQVVHRDLKPENILITDNGNNPKIIDFGFSDSDVYVILKQAAGTAQYIAPEQYHGASTDVRADIYSFGVILKELFADKRLGRVGRRYRNIASKCTLSIDKRIPDADELLRLIRSAEHPANILPVVSAVAACVLLIVCGILFLRPKDEHFVEGTNIPYEEIDRFTVGYTPGQRMQLIRALQSFTKYRPKMADELTLSMEQRQRFVHDFRPDSILRMTTTDYDISNPQGFCFRLRNEMPLLGDMLAYPVSTCFGRGLSEEECLDMRRSISQVIGYGYVDDMHRKRLLMGDSPLSQRLLAVYYPSRYLPIIDYQQLNVIVQRLVPDAEMRHKYAPDGDIRLTNGLLIRVHDSYSMFSDWSLPEFAYFLTHYYPLSDR